MKTRIKHALGAVVLFGASFLPGTVIAADVAQGQRIYQIHCAACHGARGESMIPNAPNFSRGERLMQADFALMATIRSGKVSMPAFAGVLRDQQILDVIAYLRTLQR